MRISDWSSDVCSSDLGQYTPYASESPLSLPFRIGGKRSSQDQTQLHRARSPMSASIALVDDDRNILTSVSLALQADGFQTSIYTEAATALQAVLERAAEPATRDLKMPRVDGVEGLR